MRVDNGILTTYVVLFRTMDLERFATVEISLTSKLLKIIGIGAT